MAAILEVCGRANRQMKRPVIKFIQMATCSCGFLSKFTLFLFYHTNDQSNSFAISNIMAFNLVQFRPFPFFLFGTYSILIRTLFDL